MGIRYVIGGIPLPGGPNTGQVVIVNEQTDTPYSTRVEDDNMMYQSVYDPNSSGYLVLLL